MAITHRLPSAAAVGQSPDCVIPMYSRDCVPRIREFANLRLFRLQQKNLKIVFSIFLNAAVKR